MNARFKLFGHTVVIIKEADREKLGTEGIWVTKTGKSMKVSDMDDQHLVNAIKFKERMAIGQIGGMGFRPSTYSIKTIGREIFEREPINLALVEEARRRISQKIIQPFELLGHEVK